MDPVRQKEIREQKNKTNSVINTNIAAGIKKDFLKEFPEKSNRITAIIGICKNAGKTTFLNWLISNLYTIPKGVLTTGRDGEEKDLIYDNKKPKVVLPPDTFFTVTGRILEKNFHLLTIKEKLPFKSGGEYLWLAQSDYELETEICGPPSVNEQQNIASLMLENGADMVMIDGAFDRRAIAHSSLINSIIISVGPSFGNLEDIITELDHIILLTELKEITLPECNTDRICLIFSDRTVVPTDNRIFSGNEKSVFEVIAKNVNRELEAVYFPGALTDSSLRILSTRLKPGCRLVFQNPFKVMISHDSIKQLLENFTILVLKKINLQAIIVNSYSANGNHIDCELIRESLRNRYDIAVFDVNEL